MSIDNVCEHAPSTFKRNSYCFVAMGFGNPLKRTDAVAEFCPIVSSIKWRLREYFEQCTGCWYLKRCADKFIFRLKKKELHHAQGSL